MLHPMISLVDKDKSETKEDIEKSSNEYKYYIIDNKLYELKEDILGYKELRNIFTGECNPLTAELNSKLIHSIPLNKRELIEKIKDTKYNSIITNRKVALDFVTINPNSLEYISPKMQTESICLTAVKQDGLAIKYVEKENLTERICREALNNNIMSSTYIPDKFLEMIFEKI